MFRSCSPNISPRDQRGYTLLEVLVALVILAASATVLLSAMSAGFRAHRVAAERLLAVAHAESVLAMAEVQPFRSASDRTGIIDDKYRWRLDLNLEKRESSDAASAGDDFHRLVTLVVTIYWTSAGREQKFELRTVRYLSLG